MVLSPALAVAIRERAAKLERGDGRRMTRCSVTVAKVQIENSEKREFQVDLEIGTTDRKKLMARDRDADVFVALENAFASAMRQLSAITLDHDG